MKIQSLSVVVPNIRCINDCKFCVSKMKESLYPNQIDDNLPFFDLYLKDYIKRLEYARNNGCNTVMLTGDSEPQQNRKFLTYFGIFMKLMRNPFENIEMQTTGVLLDRNYLRFLRNHVGVNLISLSISSFDDCENNTIIGRNLTTRIDLGQLTKDIKEYDFSLRLSLNLNKSFSKFNAEDLLEISRHYGADQVTFRVLYSDDEDTPQAKWVKENALPKEQIQEIKDYILKEGKVLGVLPYGAKKYSIKGMSVVIDEDCMAKNIDNNEENYKYLILQPNCKLYSQWDDSASLIF